MAPTLFLMCGLPCSGKTTLARRLERERHALRLTPDEWIAQLLSEEWDQAELDRLRSPVEAVQWDVAARVLALGVDVILDWGLWGRGERDDFRARGEALGARVEVCFLDVPQAELASRLAARNAELPAGHPFRVNEEQLELWSTWFEPPMAEEFAPRGSPSRGSDGPSLRKGKQP
jgi:predicted kinase